MIPRATLVISTGKYVKFCSSKAAHMSRFEMLRSRQIVDTSVRFRSVSPRNFCRLSQRSRAYTPLRIFCVLLYPVERLSISLFFFPHQSHRLPSKGNDTRSCFASTKATQNRNTDQKLDVSQLAPTQRSFQTPQPHSLETARLGSSFP